MGGIPDWPFDAAEARRRQLATGLPDRRTLEIADGIRLNLALIPAGDFVMGDRAGYRDERPVARVSIDAPFWMGVCACRRPMTLCSAPAGSAA